MSLSASLCSLEPRTLPDEAASSQLWFRDAIANPSPRG